MVGRRILWVIPLAAFLCFKANAQRPLTTKATISGFYTGSLSSMLDVMMQKSGIRIVYDPEMIAEYNVVDHYNNENVKDLLLELCKRNRLRYWIDADQIVYIIRTSEDVDRLKKIGRQQLIAKEKIVPVRPVLSIEDLKEEGPEKKGPFNITGKILDNANGESLPATVVTVRNTNIRTKSNADGYFTLLNVPSDTCILDVHYVGYQPEVFFLNQKNIKEELVIKLFVAVRALNEVTISDKKGDGLMSTDKRRVSILQISPAKLDELPNIGEKDILRSFQLMPGISGSNESSSGAYVRGGTPDQNLVLFDGFTVYQVDHLYGFFSAFNSNAVKDVTLYKGGFSAKYGGRLSSVIDIVGKEGNIKEANITADLSLLSANVFLESPLGSKSSLLLAYRHSYQGPLYDKIFEKFNASSTTASGSGGGPGLGMGRPGGGGGGFGGGAEVTVSTPFSYFYDLNAKYTYTPDQNNKISWSIYQGNDNLDNTRTISLPSSIAGGTAGGIGMTDKTTYGNLGSSLKWSTRWSPKLYANTLVSYSKYHSDRDNTSTINITDTTGVSQEIRTGTLEKNSLEDFSLKSDWEYQATGKLKLNYGGFASNQRVYYENSQNDTSKLIDQDTKAITAGGYVELETDLGDHLQLKGGLRGTYYDQTRKFYAEPRFSATYTLTDRITLKAATGQFYQFANRVIREDVLSGSRDFWVLSNNTAIPVSSSKHFIAGASYEAKNYLIDVEAYYKKLDNLSEYSQRMTGGGRRGEQQNLEEHFYTGSGYSKGVEVLLQKTRGKYTGWLSYTLAEATNNFDVYGGEFAASQDTRHELKLVNLYHLGRWAFSATWTFATGKPYTAPLTSYTVDDYTGQSHSYLTISDKNTLRMAPYHRMDVAVTYDLLKVDSRKTGSIGFSLFNVYNRSNIWYKQYTIVNNQVITSNVNYLGLTPNLTLSLRWK
ncbi:TonB-dependent receptor [Pedobacter gandavensis]|uniref:TonB-dependent receptor plug domain-containing protein n=1 Tax=Pedobacter gandavensis TaxID=2679963 RepID=A0ABR6EZ30_9SPHI|nr:TonB-dependent receptor [Pedobacter gandavensis]MBB2150525.1 TonB-dependent receptor plug domain-containing protein [Pedobacter gandavensis]